MHYTLLDVVGCGASGTVHRAWDQRRKRYVAVKRVPAGTPATGPGVDHPHVLAHLDRVDGVDGEDVLVVMDLVRGGSLLDLRAEHGRLPAAYVSVVLEQLLHALVAVHAAGIVHRDVKPANLLLDATGSGRPHVRLADFGDETTIGTRGYLAPEREEGAPAHPSQDVYAAGMLVRRLIEVPGPLSTLAASMTRADPGLRPTAAQALARMRSLPVPRGGSWPHVPDRVGPSPVRRRLVP